jgi:hypothetical protein
VKTEQVAALPKFDTGQYEGCEFVMSGGDARLTIRLSELPAFEVNFYRARWHQFTAMPNCSVQIKGAESDAAIVEVWNCVHVDISLRQRIGSARGSATREAIIRRGEPVLLQLWVRVFCVQSRRRARC